MQLILTQKVAQREVVELDTYTSDDTGLSPSQRQLQLVVGLLLQLPVDVHGAVLRVGLHVRINGFGIEVSHGGNLTIGAHQGLFVEQVARFGAQFTSYHLLIEAVVAEDLHVAQVRLWSLNDTYFQINAVAHDIHLGGINL